ncbi:YbfB/YjiJ family MFS transporter [Nitrincola sp. MINF-07-Sa-05]|uniref:YbfB/YjiJ family MFS transporter n=1 Tax=Nitrincola salilacus TaxID=3400273 RepID=UPI003918015D
MRRRLEVYLNRETVHLVLLGMAATGMGIGLGRFAYAALVPGMIEAGWFSERTVGLMGAVNLLGYLLGAVTASSFARRYPVHRIIQCSALGIVLSFLLCILPQPSGWFYLWRFIAGMTGALLMVLGPASVMRLLPEAVRKVASTCVFAGIGVGILLSATLVPMLVKHSNSFGWAALGIAGLLVFAYMFRWPAVSFSNGQHARALDRADKRALLMAGVGVVIVAYALDAAAFVPHTVFWVDYLQRHLGWSSAAGGFQWALFGIGAILGPFLVAMLSARFEVSHTLLIALLLKSLAIMMPTFLHAPIFISLSSLAVGALIPGVVALTSGRLAELVGLEHHAWAWGLATATFALSQAFAGFGFAALYSGSFSAGSVFVLAGSLAMIGVFCLLLIKQHRVQV